MTFQEYLISKKINPETFERNDNARFLVWLEAFNQAHPAAFTARHLFTINAVRRKFRYSGESKTNDLPESKIKPAIRPKIA